MFDGFVHPQYKNFCGICSVITICNTLFKISLTQKEAHQKYNAGYYTKRRLNHGSCPETEQLELVNPLGMSNFDVIRLFNSISINAGFEPNSALLTGLTLSDIDIESFLDWLTSDNNNAVIHIKGHYVSLMGFLLNETGLFWIVLDSKRKGEVSPISTIPHSKIINLSKESDKYGFILLSDTKIDFLDKHLKNKAVFPKESILKSVIC